MPRKSVSNPTGFTREQAEKFIRSKRKARILTQAQLAALISMKNPHHLSAFENGKFHVGRSAYIGGFHTALGLTPEELR